jgi:hypothetical protein
MKSRLTEYLQQYPPPPSPPQRTSIPVQTVPPNNSDIKVYLVFQSAEYCDEILTALNGLPAVFYLTADEIRDNAEFVRRAVGTHFQIGIYSSEEQLPAALAYLREVAAITTDIRLDALPTPMTPKTAQTKLEAARNLVLLNLKANETNIEQILTLITAIQEGNYNVSAPDESALALLKSSELQ